MLKFASMAMLKRRPKGLAARAVALIVGVMAATTLAASVAVWYGVEQENSRNQASVAGDLATRFAASTAALVTSAGVESAASMVQAVATQRTDLRLLGISDDHGRALSQHGGTTEDAVLAAQLAGQAVRTGLRAQARSADGAIAVSAPMMADGQVLGAITIIWKPETFRFNVALALAPFFLLLACVILATIPIAMRLVREAVAPLDSLTQFAKTYADRGETKPLEVKTGDEFETLANAFNQMMTRIDTSMKRIQEIAFVDPVTQLPNQDRFQREVDFFVLQSSQHHQSGAVLVFELQRLPRLLQTLDPEASRQFMRTVAERFTHAVRTVDRVVRVQGASEKPAVAARLGAQDFAVFAPGIAAPADAARFAQHLNAALNQPFDWRGHKLSLGAVCGVALAPRDGNDADAIIRHARMALQAAHSAPAKLKIYSQSLDREAVARLTLEREMRGALERNEFRAFFQPKINLATGKIEAAEALARWVRADRTIVSPGRFIPVAEESGLIGPLSEAIMREACWKAAAWARAGLPVKMAVNVSALQFRNDKFAEGVLQIVRNSGLPASSLELEITESVVMEDPERALRLIQPLRAAGVRLAIDDFGCGHSSLATLSKLPFDVIKIDQQFVRALERGEGQAEAIIDMILALARSLNLEVVAEGVERREHVEFMAKRGCQWVQGFVFGAAVSAQEFTDLLRGGPGEEIASADAA